MLNKTTDQKRAAKPAANQLIQKTVATARLLDAYGVLLPEKQKKYLTYFYEEDFSLAEIGEKFLVSRQAVHDAIRHGEAQLQDYEATLHLVAKDISRQKTADQLKQLTGNKSSINELIDKLL